MNTPIASGTLESLLYDPDETERRSPMLQARRLHLHISPSPPPDATQVKPTRGDAVLLTFMGDGKIPEIATIAGTQVLDDDDSIDEDEDSESDPGEEKMEKPEDGDYMDETPDSGTLVVPLSSASSTASRAQRGNTPLLAEIMGVDNGNDSGRPYGRSCSLQATPVVSPPITTTAIPLHTLIDDDDGIDPRSVQNRTTADYDMVTVASLALSTAQQASSRPAIGEQASRESSPNKYKSMPMGVGLLSLDDRKRSFGSDERSSFNSFVCGSGSTRSPPSNIQQYMIDSPQTLEASSQLLTPASITTPQESASMLARDDRSMNSPNEYPVFSFSPKGPSSALPVSLPPIHPFGEQCSASAPSPASLTGGRENTQSLPSIHQLSLSPVSDPVVEDQRLGTMTSNHYGRPIAHAHAHAHGHGHLPTTSAPSLSSLPSLPGVASITQGQSPPISPRNINMFRRDSDLASVGVSTSPYYGSSYGVDYGNGNRHEPASLGMGGLPSLSSSRTHPSLAPATVMTAPVPPPPRRLSSDSLSSSKGERKMPGEMPATTGHTTNHSNHAGHSINHSAAGNFKCRVPGCTAPPFQTQYLLNSHANVHSSDRPHYCVVRGCPRSRPGHGFKRKNEMIRHGLVHESPGYVCPFCQDREHKYPRPDNLQRHVRAHHREKPKDDPQLRDVLAQRPDGPNHRRRRRIA